MLESFQRETITACINKSYLVQFSIKDQQCNIMSNIILPESTRDVNKYVIIGEIRVVLDTDDSTLCILLFYGSVLNRNSVP